MIAAALHSAPAEMPADKYAESAVPAGGWSEALELVGLALVQVPRGPGDDVGDSDVGAGHDAQRVEGESGAQRSRCRKM